MKLLTKNNLLTYTELQEYASSEGVVVLIDKDETWTSFNVVSKLRYFSKVKKVGHAGTLDPLATGLLIIGLGKATKLMDSFQAQKKIYTGEIKIGCTTKTDDREAEEENFTDYNYVNKELIEQIRLTFLGKIKQTPPIFCAKIINGVRLYHLARKNEIVEIPEVEVEIFNFKITKIDLPLISFEIECSKGTYIRAISRDFGKALGCGGYMHSLRREASGEYSVNDAFKINEFISILETTKDESLQTL
ncbi:MAG: tRNA pseudouridine(55) synthase TruB [Candidatus Kapabacteria bacterium]|nr:tRNA pseudouridine(55) synthase TruB [Candidatus Kapabacteria bacterium]